MEAVLFIGIPGSGKSTFYRQRFFDTHVRINLDMLRTRRREQLLIAACIAGKQRYVIDNTNVTQADRAPYIAQAKTAGFRVVGYYFEASLGECIARNKARPEGRAVPVKGIAAKYHRLQAPAREEGFDELYQVTIGPEGELLVQDLV